MKPWRSERQERDKNGRSRKVEMRKKTQTVKWRLCGAVVLIPAEKEARRSNAKGDKQVKMPSVKLKEELIDFEWKKRRLKERKKKSGTAVD